MEFRFLKILVFLFALIIFTNSANAFDLNPFNWFKLQEQPSQNVSQCGNKVAEFRAFLRDARICKQDDDCVTVQGTCPLGCRFNVNKVFAEMVSNRVERIKDFCADSVCPNKCQEFDIKPACINNKCDYSSKRRE